MIVKRGKFSKVRTLHINAVVQIHTKPRKKEKKRKKQNEKNTHRFNPAGDTDL